MKQARREPVVLLVLTVVGLAVSGIAPRSRVTWFLEVSPVLVGVALLVATYRRFPLTPLVYRLAFVLACLLMIGGHYTFSRVPFGMEAKIILGLKRNDYDRVVHFASGVVASVLGYELLRRKTRYQRRGWLFFFVVSGFSPAPRSTNSSNGGSRGCPARRRTPFWRHRVTAGTPNGTCS